MTIEQKQCMKDAIFGNKAINSYKIIKNGVDIRKTPWYSI